MKGGPQFTNNTSQGNPMVRYDYSNYQNNAAKQEPLRNPFGRGGGLAPGNQSSLNNPLVMPNSYARNRQAEDYNKGWSKDNSITKPPAQGGGLKTTNDSSANNPFNTRSQQDYDMYKNQNQEWSRQNPIRAVPLKSGGGGGGAQGSFKPTNDISANNPMYNPSYGHGGPRQQSYTDDQVRREPAYQNYDRPDRGVSVGMQASKAPANQPPSYSY